jgi:hypothetical protein
VATPCRVSAGLVSWAISRCRAYAQTKPIPPERVVVVVVGARITNIEPYLYGAARRSSTQCTGRCARPSRASAGQAPASAHFTGTFVSVLQPKITSICADWSACTVLQSVPHKVILVGAVASSYCQPEEQSPTASCGMET